MNQLVRSLKDTAPHAIEVTLQEHMAQMEVRADGVLIERFVDLVNVIHGEEFVCIGCHAPGGVPDIRRVRSGPVRPACWSVGFDSRRALRQCRFPARTHTLSGPQRVRIRMFPVDKNWPVDVLCARFARHSSVRL